MANDLWRTPPEVFNKLHKEFNFLADMASTNENALLPINFTEHHDSLSFDWAEHDALQSEHLRYVWCNPPYSDPLPWINQATEAQKAGLGSVFLLNCDHSITWFAMAESTVSEIRYIIPDEKKPGGSFKSGRLAFLDGDGEPQGGNNKGQFILVFNPFKISTKHTMYVGKSTFYTE